MKYKVGTIIKFSAGLEGIGEIVETESGINGNCYLVKLLGENAGEGHDGHGISKKTYETDDYWFVRDEHVLSAVEFEEINIIREGNTVHAVMKNGDQVVYHAKAVCSPDDEFDFWIGSTIAYSRLIAQMCEIIQGSD